MLANEVQTFPSTAYTITQNVEHVAENATAPSVFGTSQGQFLLMTIVNLFNTGIINRFSDRLEPHRRQYCSSKCKLHYSTISVCSRNNTILGINQ
jgi:hypothetical protein